MKKWLFVVIGLALLAGAAFAVRQTGIDVVALAGFKSAVGTVAKPEVVKPAGQPNALGGGRGPLPVEIAKASTVTVPLQPPPPPPATAMAQQLQFEGGMPGGIRFQRA